MEDKAGMHILDRAAIVLTTGSVPSSGTVSGADGADGWEALDAAARDRARGRVRDILKVLRDPDERMMEAGAEIIRNVGREESEAARHNDAADTWRFMIDALLTTGK